MLFVTNPTTLLELERRGLNDNQVSALRQFLKGGLRVQYCGRLGVWLGEAMELFDCGSLDEFWLRLRDAGISVEDFLVVDREATEWVC